MSDTPASRLVLFFCSSQGLIYVAGIIRELRTDTAVEAKARAV